MRVFPIKPLHLFLAALVALWLVACSQSTPATEATDTTQPTVLALLDAQTRVVTGESVIIMGAVSDDGGVGGVKALSYSLNGGARQDVTSSLNEGNFSFTVTGLREGKNDLTVSAADAAGNEGSVTLTVEVAPPAAAFPTLEGVWTAAGVATGMCDQRSSSVTFIFDAPQESGALAGLWHMVDDSGSGQMTGSFAGTLSRVGTLKGVATLTYDGRPARFDLAFAVSGETVKGSLRSQEDVTCWSQKSPVAFDVTLKTFQDDAFETNNRAENAATVGLDFNQNLTLRGGDEDWFTFVLPKAHIVTLGLGTNGSYYDTPVVELLDASFKRLTNNDYGYHGDELSLGLEAGTYYLRVFSGSFKHYTYSLSLSTATLPDETFEPNNTKTQATPVSPGFTGDFYLTVGDEDWFTFTLAKEQVVTLYLGKNSGLRYAYDGAAGTSADYYGGRPVARALKAGTHTLRVFSESQTSTAYALSLSVSPLPDEAFEPNNTFSTPTNVTLPFSRDLFMSGGDEDWFKFTLSEEQLVTFGRTDGGDYWHGLSGVLYTDVGTEVKRFGLSARDTQLALLPAGTYRLNLSASEGFAYSLALSAESTNDASFEPNNTSAKASAITLDFANDKLLVGDGDTDWFKFTLTQGTQVEVSLATTEGVHVGLYDENQQITSLYGPGTVSPVLSPGTYYLSVESYWGLSKYGLSVAKK